ncbi:hypothetical protein [Bowmanella denitrificans]|uniref:hypothetical protein n=1 Tax=Bowmanella denitrificans TaxID=366582 RepID=UPI000C9CB473|nr:hypothetical protein [Bowmanella denitrificans]
MWSFENLFRSDVWKILAIDLGLLTIGGWFVIIWMIIRECRLLFGQTQRQDNQAVSQALAFCQTAVDNALERFNRQAELLSEVLKVHESLEKQTRDIRLDSQGDSQASNPEQDQKLEELTTNLKKSHALIRKLRTDLDQSQSRLKQTKQKLFEQFSKLDEVTRENAQIRAKVEELQQDMSESITYEEFEQANEQFAMERERLQEMANKYRDEVARLNQRLIQSAPNQTELSRLKQQSKEAQDKLSQKEQELYHIKREKEFLEGKYLELLNQIEDPPA